MIAVATEPGVFTDIISNLNFKIMKTPEMDYLVYYKIQHFVTSRGGESEWVFSNQDNIAGACYSLYVRQPNGHYAMVDLDKAMECLLEVAKNNPGRKFRLAKIEAIMPKVTGLVTVEITHENKEEN